MAWHDFSFRFHCNRLHQGFGSAFFFADPGKNLHADPDPGGTRGRGVVVKGKNENFI